MKKTLLLALLLLCAETVFAAEQKIGTVDLDRIFREYFKTKIVEGNLKRQADLYTEYMAKQQEELRRLQEKFNELRDASQNIVLTDAARESKRLAAADVYAQLNQKETELRDYGREKQAQLRDDQERERSKILEEIKTVIRNQSVLAGYTIVLDKSAFSASGMPVILFSEKTLDITDSVIRELNDGQRKTEKKAEEPEKK